MVSVDGLAFVFARWVVRQALDRKEVTALEDAFTLGCKTGQMAYFVPLKGGTTC